jgi:hypothetical protein
MYLIHVTGANSLKSILKDGYLKSFSLIKKSGRTPKDGWASGLYTKNKFVFFSCCEKIFDDKILGPIILYFNSKLLYDKSFYVSTVWSPYPNDLGEWYSGGKNNKKKEYKRKYDKNYSRYNSVLKKLYYQSKKKFKYYQYFQQVSVQNKVNLKELVGIEFIENFFNEKQINYFSNYISKNYPNIEIKISKPRNMEDLITKK